jgi:hypothetical protein
MEHSTSNGCPNSCVWMLDNLKQGRGLTPFAIVNKKWWPGVSSLIILGEGVALAFTFL